MRKEDFEFVSGIVKQNSGLYLTPEKFYLIESRLLPVSRKWGFANLEELLQNLRVEKKEAMKYDIVEAMTTNESFFFRDQKPFDYLKDDIIPSLIKTRPAGSKIRIWSAACSSGQELYSIAMTLKENPNLTKNHTFELIGTDISRAILDKAKEGTFTQFEVQRGLPIMFLMKYFQQQNEKWIVKDELKQMVSFKEGNLLHDFSLLGKFDIVFCRNVLIYFEPEVKKSILAKISKILPTDGCLVLGGAETVLGLSNEFFPSEGKRGVYSLTQAENKKLEAV